ncbi:PREDICTED: centrosomal protein of 63 kDa [Nanorana parkeri]|uniref:centrosomal protein of 63 kDa n=1 Tax=Nanorana parkeri TaxID=125878 RepID=UPI0008541480|nr:PREDICTED: centrosomal protein of 63 kDa [Nanorana parkeri]
MEALLEGMQKKGKTGALYSSCEAELQELMRQIDIMLEHKKAEWEAHNETLNTLLQLREQELNTSRAREERLSQEAGGLLPHTFMLSPRQAYVARNIRKVALTGQGFSHEQCVGLAALYSSCEAELQELMRQIDIMLEHKKAEWEAHNETLNTLLQLREQELNTSRAREERLSQEIKTVRKQLAEQEESNLKKTAAYESQLTQFQEELNKLKRSYEKVQRRHHRLEVKGKAEEEKSEVSRLTRRLEEFRQRSLDWEKQRLLYQQQLAALEAQRRTLGEQAEIYQQQSQSRKQMLEQTSLAGRSEVHHLSGQLSRANDSLCAKEGEVESLKQQLESSSAGQERAEKELEQAQHTIKVLQEEKAELRVTIQAQTDFLQGSKAQKEELHREVCRVNETLRERENSIRSLEERLKGTRLSDGRTEVDVLRSQLSISHLNEQRLQDEVSRLESHIESVTLQCQKLAKEIKEKAESRQLLEEEHKKCWTEIKKLKSQLSQAELSYSSVLDGMKKEISQLTQELHQRDIVSSSNTVKDWERRVQVEKDRADREAAERKVSLTALESLREENWHLKEKLEKQEPDVLLALENLECENRRLQKELCQTRKDLEHVVQTQESDIQTAVDRKSQVLLDKHEAELNTLNERLNEVSRQYEELLSALQPQRESAFVLKGLSRTSSLESVSSEHSKGDVHTDDDSNRSQLPMPPSSPASTIAARFLQEEELRSQDLFQRLDSHIEELKQESHRTLQHFTNTR